MDIKRLTIRLPVDIIRNLKIVAAENDKKLNELTIEGIEYIVEKYKRKEKKGGTNVE